MAHNAQPVALSKVVMLAAGAIVVAALYFAQDVLIPLALAILFSFLLAPLVRRLERLHLGRIAAVLIVVVLSSCLILGIGYLVTSQLVSLTYKLPEYRENIRHKAQALRGRGVGGIEKMAETIKEIRKELATQPATASAPGVATVEPAPHVPPTELPPAPGVLEERTFTRPPVPVEVVEPTSLLSTARGALGYLAGPLGTAAIVFVLVVFMLIQREDLRDRFIALMGRGRINVTTIAMDDAAQRISRYLLMQLIVNASYGIPVGIGLYFIGLPNALLWGLLATLLRYLPYVGPWLAASMPIILSLAVFDDWYHVGMVVGMFIILEIISNNAIEPLLYGSSTGLSTVAVLVAAVFWTWLWGPVGLLLATPMTACLVVLGKYIPQLEFLTMLLGDQPAFPPAVRFYQRLVAMDQEEAEDLVEEYFEKSTLLQAYDEFLIPAMHLVEEDRHRGRLDPERYEFIMRTIRSMVEELGETKITTERQEAIERMRSETEAPEHAADEPAKTEEAAAPALVPGDLSILCVPARDEADEIAAHMYSQVLEAKGLRSVHVTATHLASEVIGEIQETSSQIVCISAMPPGALTHARYLCKRLQPLDDVQIIVGLWDTKTDVNRVGQRLACAGTTQVVRKFREAIELVWQMARRRVTHANNGKLPDSAVA